MPNPRDQPMKRQPVKRFTVMKLDNRWFFKWLAFNQTDPEFDRYWFLSRKAALKWVRSRQEEQGHNSCLHSFVVLEDGTIINESHR